MDEPDKTLQRHYRAQQLAPDQLKAILAAGSTAAERRKRLRHWKLAAAAAITLCLTAWSIATESWRSSKRVPLAEIAPALVNYFSQPAAALPVISEDRAKLKEWLGAQGAPTQFVIPPAFARLKSVGCEVLHVHGHQVALLCFVLDATSLKSIGAAHDGVAAAGPQLVHLLVVSRSLVRDTPNVGQVVQLEPMGQWRVIAWATDDFIYLAATDVAAVRLGDFANRVALGSSVRAADPLAYLSAGFPGARFKFTPLLTSHPHTPHLLKL